MINRSYMSALVLFVTFTAQASITINDKKLNEIAKPGEIITYKDPNADNIVFYFNNKNLEIGSASFSKPQFINDHLQKIQESGLCEITSKIISIKAGGDNIHEAFHMTGTKVIFLKAGGLMSIESSILQSPEIFLSSTNFALHSCFIKDSQYLQLENSAKDSLFRVIRFKFLEKSPLPYSVEGVINLETGEMSKRLIVTGANEMQILFNEPAFKD